MPHEGLSCVVSFTCRIRKKIMNELHWLKSESPNTRPGCHTTTTLTALSNFLSIALPSLHSSPSMNGWTYQRGVNGRNSRTFKIIWKINYDGKPTNATTTWGDVVVGWMNHPWSSATQAGVRICMHIHLFAMMRYSWRTVLLQSCVRRTRTKYGGRAPYYSPTFMT